MNRAQRRAVSSRTKGKSSLVKAWPYCNHCQRPVARFRIVPLEDQVSAAFVVNCHGEQRVSVKPLRDFYAGKLNGGVAFEKKEVEGDKEASEPQDDPPTAPAA